MRRRSTSRRCSAWRSRRCRSGSDLPAASRARTVRVRRGFAGRQILWRRSAGKRRSSGGASGCSGFRSEALPGGRAVSAARLCGSVSGSLLGCRASTALRRRRSFCRAETIHPCRSRFRAGVNRMRRVGRIAGGGFRGRRCRSFRQKMGPEGFFAARFGCVRAFLSRPCCAGKPCCGLSRRRTSAGCRRLRRPAPALRAGYFSPSFLAISFGSACLLSITEVVL